MTPPTFSGATYTNRTEAFYYIHEQFTLEHLRQNQRQINEILSKTWPSEEHNPVRL